MASSKKSSSKPDDNLEMESDLDEPSTSSQPSKCRSSKRLSPAQNLWNELVGTKLRDCIPSHRLPTNRVVMQRYRSMRTGFPQKTPVRSFAGDLCREVAQVWDKANIPIKTEKAAIQTITRLLSSWTSFSASSNKCKKGSVKYEKYTKMLDELCDIAIGDEEELKCTMRATRLPTWERDFEFYLNQKSGKIDQMEGLDTHSVKRQKSADEHREQEAKRRENESERASQSSVAASREAAKELDLMNANCQEDEEDPIKAQDPDAHLSSRQKYNMEKKPDTVTLEMPRKGLAKVLTPIAGRMQLSNRQSFAYAAEVIKAGKGKVADFAMSKSSFYLQRKGTEEELASKLMNEFRNDPKIKFVIVHWDGKKVKLADRSIQEHIPILLQPVGSERPPYFIGAPQVPDGTGLSMKDAIVEYIGRIGSGCMEKTIGICFDTTASNTGVHNGAAALLENHLNKALLWFACRHHVAELHMGWADEAVRHAIGKHIIGFTWAFST